VFVGGAVGNLAASVLTPPLARRVAGWRWVTLLLALEGLAIAVFGPAFTPYLLAIAVFVVNLAGQGVKIVVDTDLQHECADDYRGRVFSLGDTAFNASFVLGLFGAALVLPGDGRSVETLYAVALGFVVVGVWYAFAGGRWAMRVGDDIRQPEESEVPEYERV
jgi:predicted MFS family arabinose efflux permease